MGVGIFVANFLFEEIFDSFGLDFDVDGFLMVDFSEILVGLLGFFDFLDDLFWSVFLLNVGANVGDKLLDVCDNFVNLDFLNVLGVPLLFGKVGQSSDAYGFIFVFR